MKIAELADRMIAQNPDSYDALILQRNLQRNHYRDLAQRLARIVEAERALVAAREESRQWPGSFTRDKELAAVREYNEAEAAVSDDELTALRIAETAQDAVNGHPPPSGDAATPVDASAGATADDSGIGDGVEGRA